MIRNHALPWIALLIFGAGWGAMQPANKVVVEAGFEPFGIMVWQGVITLLLAGAFVWRHGAPRGKHQWMLCAQIAILGTMIPHFATFTAVMHLPAGLMAIILSTIPIFALAMGLVTGREVLTWRLALGLCLGLMAITLIAASRGELTAGAVWAVLLGLAAPLCYATNSTLIAGRGLAGLHPLQAFAGAAMIFLPVSIVVAYFTGQLRVLDMDLASTALIGTAVAHTLIYAGFLWLVAQAGAVFASQTAYLVTGFGIIWSMLFLGERYGVDVWVALVMMFIGLSLVRPTTKPVAHSGVTNEIE